MRLYKYHNFGNDFILFDQRKEVFSLGEEFVREISRRKFSVGADGVILLKEDKRGYFMEFFNSDGGKAATCGNALSVIFRFLFDIERIEKASLRSEGGEVFGKAWDGGVSVVFGEPKVLGRDILSDGYRFFLLDAGVSHAVAFSKDVRGMDLEGIGRRVRNDKVFPGGVNVSFLEKKEDRFFIRTYEKGVEAETGSCGTAALSSSRVLLESGICKYGEKVFLEFLGGRYEVFLRKGEFELISSPSFVFVGNI